MADVHDKTAVFEGMVWDHFMGKSSYHSDPGRNQQTLGKRENDFHNYNIIRFKYSVFNNNKTARLTKKEGL